MKPERIIPAPIDEAAEAFGAGMVNLVQPRLGAEAVFATDDFFGPKERMLDPAPPIFAEGRYDDHGKWMDGWESRRKRVEGFDHAVIALGLRGVARRVDIDTSFFTGNYPPKARLWGADGEDGDWFDLTGEIALKGDTHNLVGIADPKPVTRLKLDIVPDGGVARLRVYGEILPDWTRAGDGPLDLAALVNGAMPVQWNDSHYGAPQSLLAPGRGVDMGDGWETRRRREPGHDWCIIRLGAPGTVERIQIDTAHFKGNFPDTCSLQATLLDSDSIPSDFAAASQDWPLLLDKTPLTADAIHDFDARPAGPVSHVRLNIFPDGGVSRLRLFGRRAP